MTKLFGLALLSASLLFSLPVEAQATNYRLIWPAGANSFEQKIHFACAQFRCNPTQLIRVMRCESRGNPLAYNHISGATGLFQFMPSTWRSFSASSGMPGANVWNADNQIYVTAWAFSQGHARHWTCK